MAVYVDKSNILVAADVNVASNKPRACIRRILTLLRDEKDHF